MLSCAAAETSTPVWAGLQAGQNQFYLALVIYQYTLLVYYICHSVLGPVWAGASVQDTDSRERDCSE